jgi:hypothetical protein
VSRYISVLGTHAWDPRQPTLQWWHPKSAFSTYLETHGLTHAKPGRPFIWSGDLDGTWLHRGNDWEAGAEWLSYYLSDLPYDWRNVIAHSHGGQLAAKTTAMRSLVMVGTPVRKEIEKIAPVAVANIGTCVQVIDQRRDWIATAGGVFDGNLSWRREFDVLGIQVTKLPNIGHSGLLCDAKHFPKWKEAGLLSLLTQGVCA